MYVDKTIAVAVKNLHENFLLTIPGVWGVGICPGGLALTKITEQRELDRFEEREDTGYAIKVFVRSLVKDSKYEVVCIPKELPNEEGTTHVTVEIEVFPESPSLLMALPPGANTALQRPVQPGWSVGPQDITGTIGLIVQRARYTRIWPYIPSMAPVSYPYPWLSGFFSTHFLPIVPDEKYILSCQHVLGGLNNQYPPGTPIYQPGPEDAPPSSNYQIASLSQSVPLQQDNKVDCAIAALSQPSTTEIHKVGVPTGINDMQHGMRVQKKGRTTGHTRGIALVPNLTFAILTPGRSILFRDMDAYALRAAPGDSGSAICTDSGPKYEETTGGGGGTSGVTVLSLAVAYLRGTTLTFGCPIKRIFSELSIELA